MTPSPGGPPPVPGMLRGSAPTWRDHRIALQLRETLRRYPEHDSPASGDTWLLPVGVPPNHCEVLGVSPPCRTSSVSFAK